MKNNTKETRNLLEKLLMQLPQDNSLSEVRYHLKSAMNKLEDVERKRERREIKSEKRELNKSTSYNYDPLRAISAIDEEIKKERNKIDEIHKRRNKSAEEKDLNDGIQTVFG